VDGGGFLDRDDRGDHGQSAGVLYIADADAGEVRADFQFADEEGDLWRRRFGEPPEPVLEVE
jgi:hypothetical protein